MADKQETAASGKVKYRAKSGEVHERRARSKARRFTFTEMALERLRPPKKDAGAVSHWDAGTGAARGLSVLVTPLGTKTYRSTYRVGTNKTFISRAIGKVGVKSLAEVRDIVRDDQKKAAAGIDPRHEQERKEEAEKIEAAAIAASTYGAVVDEFILHYAKPRQRRWKETERILKRTCAPWVDKPMASITKHDARGLLRGFIADGHPRKATVTLSWLQTLWRWARDEDIVASALMDAVKLDVENGAKDRVYNDDEIKAIWAAASALETIEGSYIKLLLLLAPRKTALAAMRLGHLNSVETPTLWTTPIELTKTTKRAENHPKKKRRVYLTPLSPLAQRIIRPLLKREPGCDHDLVFPGHRQRNSGILEPGTALKKRLVDKGAPGDFSFHTVRHTIAEWLRESVRVYKDDAGDDVKGCSDFEVGLVLNHASTGVTAGYGGGYPLDLKRTLLSQWSDHVEGLVTAKGVALLR